MNRKTVLLLLIIWLLVGIVVETARPVLYWSSRGQHVTAAQQRLSQWEYLRANPTGYFGPATSGAVILFQGKNGLKSDGIVGQATWRALGLWNKTNSTPASSPTATTKQVSPVETNLMARLIAAEARGESWNGMVGVGAVVMNRLETSGFPTTISGVIHQPYQFESVQNGLVWQRQPNSTEMAAAKTALQGVDPTGGALFFWNPNKPISSQWIWSRTVITRIGNHVFGV